MAPKTLSFKCALITGGGGGIGKAMAETLISMGKKVIIAGRTESTLKKAAEELGHNTTYYVLDTGDIPSISPFVSKITKENPEVDCLINNAGIQRPLFIDSFSLSGADQEIDINIRGPLHLCILFLPHFLSHPSGGVIMNVSSVLGYIPTSIINPVYNGTKAWLHFFTMNMRSQIQWKEEDRVKVVEIAPPTVSTDLHREREDPDDNKEKNKGALSVEEFMGFVKKGWEEDRETIGAGMSEGVVERWFGEFGDNYEKAAKASMK